MSVKCPIWGTEAEEFPPERAANARGIDSPRAGGSYWITSSAAMELTGQVAEVTRLKLTSWLVDQRRFGELAPKISTDTLRLVRQLLPLDVEQRRDRLLLFVQSRCPLIHQSIEWDPIITPERQLITAELQAWTELEETKEVFTLIRYAREDGLLEGGRTLQLTLKGLNHISNLTHGSTQGDRCFVAMWFDPTTKQAYLEGIAPAVIEAGYVPIRIDKKEHTNKIDDEIISEICRSRFVVADFTCGFVGDTAVARGGVYYEAGFAQGLAIPVIWSCRNDVIDHVHFDTRQYNHIVWAGSSELKTKLRNRIGAVVGDGPHKAPQ